MPSEAATTRRWLNDIRYHIELAQGFIAGIAYEAFRDDLLRFYAVTRCLEIISEASRRLPDETKARHPTIAWKEMAGAGSVYRHNYEDVAVAYVWVTIHDHLPPPRIAIEHELSAFGGP